jgi:hypothetical protein
VREHLLGASNRLMLVMARLAPGLAQRIMDAIGADALKRGASRMPATPGMTDAIHSPGR